MNTETETILRDALDRARKSSTMACILLAHGREPLALNPITGVEDDDIWLQAPTPDGGRVEFRFNPDSHRATVCLVRACETTQWSGTVPTADLTAVAA